MEAFPDMVLTSLLSCSVALSPVFPQLKNKPKQLISFALHLLFQPFRDNTVPYLSLFCQPGPFPNAWQVLYKSKNGYAVLAFAFLKLTIPHQVFHEKTESQTSLRKLGFKKVKQLKKIRDFSEPSIFQHAYTSQIVLTIEPTFTFLELSKAKFAKLSSNPNKSNSHILQRFFKAF